MSQKVTKLALTSRIIVLILQLLLNLLISDHKTDVFRTPIDSSIKLSWQDRLLQKCLGGLRHWDGEYFLHISEYGYTYENTLVFYPLYPVLVGYGARILHIVMCSFLTLHTCCLLVAVLLNVYLFCKCANLIYQITQRLFNDIAKSWHSALLFCFNPASIFFSAAYSETLYFMLTLYVILECITEMRLIRSIVTLSLSILTRSNGLLNIGFLLYFGLRYCIIKANHYFRTFIKLLVIVLLALTPLILFNLYAFQQFCLPNTQLKHSSAILNYGHEKNFIIAGWRSFNDTTNSSSPWCESSFPFPYTYIQAHYWNVGFLKYYQLKQLPNFCLALPILSFLLWHSYVYLRLFIGTCLPKYPLNKLLREYKALPFVLHALFLSMCSLFFLHVQISNRLLCSASPCLYWFASEYLPKSFDKFRFRSTAGTIVMWFSTYFLVGVGVFCNNFPWT